MTRTAFAILGACLAAGPVAAAPNLKNDPRFPGSESYGEVRVTTERAPAVEFTIAPGGAEIYFFGYNPGYHVYDVAAGKVIRRLTDAPSFHDLTFSPDGKRMATAEWWDGVKLRDPKTGEVLDTLKPADDLGAFYATFLPSGKLAAYCWRSTAGAGSEMKEQLALWDADTKKRLGWDPTSREEKGGELTRRWFAGPGRHLLSMTWKTDRKVVFRRATLTYPATNRESARVDLEPDDFVCDASPDGKTLLVSDARGDLRLIEVATGKVLHRLSGHKHMVTCGAFSPDGLRMATASGTTTRSNPSHYSQIKTGTQTEVILWDVKTGKEVAVLRDTKKVHDFHTVRFSPDGRYLAATTPAESPGKGQRRGGELILWGKLPGPPPPSKDGPFPLADRLEKVIEGLATCDRPAEQKAEGLFLVLLGRYPTATERERAAAACKDAAGFRRLAESLIDTVEFREHAEGLHRRLGRQ